MAKICGVFLLLGFVVIIATAQAQEGSVVSPSSGKFSLYSKPSGALVYMEGEYEFIGHTPCEVPFLLQGSYQVRASKRGYENWAARVTLVAEQQNSLYIKLIPKTKLKTALRSTLFPGWGQYYTDRKTRGIFLGLLQAGSILGTVYAYQNYEDAKDDYYLAVDRYRNEKRFDELERLRKQMREKERDADQAWELRSTLITLAAGIWVYNVAESVLFFPRYEEAVYERGAPTISGCIRRGEPQILITQRF